MAKKSKAEVQKELAQGKSIAEVAAGETANEANTNTTTEPQAQKEPEKEKGPGKIKQIIDHFKAGKTTKEIALLPVLDADGNIIITKNEKGENVAETFHPTTISIQVNKYKKANPDLYPPKPPAETKAQKKAKADAEKAAAEANKQEESAAPADVNAAEAQAQ